MARRHDDACGGCVVVDARSRTALGRIGLSERQINSELSQIQEIFPHEEIARFEGKPLSIACTSRSGSNLLVEYLTQVGDFGTPGEHFNSFEIGLLRQNLHLNGGLTEYLGALVGESGANGTFAWKGSAYRLILLAHFGLLPNTRAWPWIFLTRENVLAQAVSLAIAEQTNIWQLRDGLEVSPRQFSYDRIRIQDAIEAIASDNARWETFFALAGITPLRLTYERLASVPEECVNLIMKAVGNERPYKLSVKDVAIKVQRTGTNDEFAERFVSEFQQGL